VGLTAALSSRLAGSASLTKRHLDERVVNPFACQILMARLARRERLH
jgi:hypothetical protein